MYNLIALLPSQRRRDDVRAIHTQVTNSVQSLTGIHVDLCLSSLGPILAPRNRNSRLQEHT